VGTPTHPRLEAQLTDLKKSAQKLGPGGMPIGSVDTSWAELGVFTATGKQPGGCHLKRGPSIATIDNRTNLKTYADCTELLSKVRNLRLLSNLTWCVAAVPELKRWQ